MYRGYRIVLVQLGRTWHAIVHDGTGAIIEKDIVSFTMIDARGQAEWFIEKHLAFRSAPRIKRRA